MQTDFPLCLFCEAFCDNLSPTFTEVAALQNRKLSEDWWTELSNVRKKENYWRPKIQAVKRSYSFHIVYRAAVIINSNFDRPQSWRVFLKEESASTPRSFCTNHLYTSSRRKISLTSTKYGWRTTKYPLFVTVLSRKLFWCQYGPYITAVYVCDLGSL